MRSSDWSSDVCSSDLRPHFGFGVVEQRLVDHAVDAARLDRVDMRHQPHIVAVIGADIGEAVAERLPLGEMLAEVGKTAVERMAPRVDDLRIGQDQADEGGVEPVVGQLVDIEGLGGLALDGGALEEGRSEEHTSELQSLMRISYAVF